MTTKEYLELIDRVNESGKYKADWKSLAHHKVPDWYMNDKLGVFIHWGIYSVPAYGSEWYSRSMYDKNVREFEYHRKTYGEHKDFGYKDFIPMFKAEPVLLDYAVNHKFADIDNGTEFLVFDHDEFKRACCQTEEENTIQFSVKEYNIKEKKWHMLEKSRCAEDIDSLIYILQKDYRFDEVKFITK